MPKYIKCPRCELNYILGGEELCEVCKVELGLDSKLTLLEDMLEEEDQLKLCPICKANQISMDEEMCDRCLALKEAERLQEDNDDWRSYLDDDAEEDDQDVEIPLEYIEEDEEEEIVIEDEENPDDDYDDFEEIGDGDYDDDFDDDDEEDVF